MWKCPGCGEPVDDQFEVCWKCQRAKPDLPESCRDDELRWEDNFQKTKQADGTCEVEAFGRKLTCAICGNSIFRERTTLLSTPFTFSRNWSARGIRGFLIDLAGALIGQDRKQLATNYICARCGYVLCFLPQ